MVWGAGEMVAVAVAVEAVDGLDALEGSVAAPAGFLFVGGEAFGEGPEPGFGPG